MTTHEQTTTPWRFFVGLGHTAPLTPLLVTEAEAEVELARLIITHPSADIFVICKRVDPPPAGGETAMR